MDGKNINLIFKKKFYEKYQNLFSNNQKFVFLEILMQLSLNNEFVDLKYIQSTLENNSFNDLFKLEHVNLYKNDIYERL